ncbi:hypothetical protein ACHAXS_002995 [Conticribra weissflogii]
MDDKTEERVWDAPLPPQRLQPMSEPTSSLAHVVLPPVSILDTPPFTNVTNNPNTNMKTLLMTASTAMTTMTSTKRNISGIDIHEEGKASFKETENSRGGNDRKTSNNDRGRIKSKHDQDKVCGNNSIDEDEDLLNDDHDYETTSQSAESPPTRSIVAIIFNKFFWLVALILVMLLLFYDDEDFISSTEEDVIRDYEKGI